jgi:hypothetical protein
MEYYISKILNVSFDEAVKLTNDALKKQTYWLSLFSILYNILNEHIVVYFV